MSVDLNILSSIKDVDDKVKAMVLALPDFRIGDRVHSIYVNKIKGATPGRHSGLYQEQERFIDLFFPRWGPMEFVGDVSRTTELDDTWWASFSVAALCQSMAVLTTDLKPQMLQDKINSTIKSYNETLRSKSMLFYCYIFMNTFSDFNTPFKEVDHDVAKEAYKKVLIDGVNIHDLWYAEGLWKNPSWEMFHHFIKLYALGANVAEINELIDTLRGKGLIIPSEVDKDKWVLYTEYFHNKYDIDHEDIDNDARKGILESRVMPYGGSMKEENSFEFTANGQPGSQYRSTGGSCFQKGALVLMQDFSLRPIEEIKAGDFVASPSGPKEVAFLSMPFRCNRTLYSVNSIPLKFTATHPFINKRGLDSELNPYVISMDPSELRWLIPTLSRIGIDKMEEGSSLTGIKLYGDNYINSEAVNIRTIERYNSEENDKYEILYDVILKQDSSGIAEYIVGSREQLFLVSSEVPYALKSPFASIVMFEALDIFLPSIKDDLSLDDNEKSIDAFFEKLQEVRRKISSGFLHKVVGRTETKEESFEMITQDIIDYASKYMRLFMIDNNEFNWKVGNIFEMLTSEISREFDSMVELGFRNFNNGIGEVISISIQELEFDNISISKNTLLKLNVTLNTGKVEKKYTIDNSQGRLNTNFVHFFDKVLYFEEKNSMSKLIESISFELLQGNYEKLLLSGCCNFLNKFSVPFKTFCVVFKNIEGENCGKLFFDIRLIQKEIVYKENLKFINWNESSKLFFAKVLGKEVGNALVEIWKS